MWLHLVCGLSHEKCRQAIVYITYMIKYHDQFKRQKDFCDHIPKDLHTITKHLGLDLELEEFICCQKCYSLYEIDVAPFECSYQVVPGADACSKDLFSPHIIKDIGGVTRASEYTTKRPHFQLIPHATNPASLFICQSFQNWLGWLLKLPDIENSIDDWSNHLSSMPEDPVIDIQQSNAWKKLF